MSDDGRKIDAGQGEGAGPDAPQRPEAGRGSEQGAPGDEASGPGLDTSGSGLDASGPELDTAGSGLGPGGPTTAAARPRAWPVVLAYLILWVGVLLFGAVAATLAVIRHTGGAVGALDEEGLRRVMLEATGTAGFLAFSIMGIAVIDLLVCFAAVRLERPWLGDRLRLRAARGRRLLVYGGAAAGTIFVGQALTSLVGLAGIETSEPLRRTGEAIAGSSPAAFAALLLGAGLLAPLGEELFFRGYAQTRLTARFSPAAGIVLAAAGFGLLHMDLMHTPLAFGLGLFLGWIVEASGSIRPAIFAHMTNNVLFLVVTRATAEAEEPTRAAHGVWAVLSVAAVGAAFAAVRRGTRSGS